MRLTLAELMEYEVSAAGEGEAQGWVGVVVGGGGGGKPLRVALHSISMSAKQFL